MGLTMMAKIDRQLRITTIAKTHIIKNTPFRHGGEMQWEIIKWKIYQTGQCCEKEREEMKRLDEITAMHMTSMTYKGEEGDAKNFKNYNQRLFYINTIQKYNSIAFFSAWSIMMPSPKKNLYRKFNFPILVCLIPMSVRWTFSLSIANRNSIEKKRPSWN